MRHEVNDIDYARETMIVDVRYRVGSAPAQPQPEERRLDVKLDVIHSDDAALVADLERRLGGRVVRHEVKDIDYVRDTMEVDVRYRVWTVARRTRGGRLRLSRTSPARRRLPRSAAHRSASTSTRGRR